MTCTDVVKDPQTHEITEIHCTYDPATRGGDSPGGRKVRGTIHWVAADHCYEAQVRLYDRLFLKAAPDDAPAGKDFKSNLNPDSLKTVDARLEPGLAHANPDDRYQFERKGYFFVDPVDSKPGRPVFNQIVALRDSWARLEKTLGKPMK